MTFKKSTVDVPGDHWSKSSATRHAVEIQDTTTGMPIETDKMNMIYKFWIILSIIESCSTNSNTHQEV